MLVYAMYCLVQTVSSDESSSGSDMSGDDDDEDNSPITSTQLARPLSPMSDNIARMCVMKLDGSNLVQFSDAILESIDAFLSRTTVAEVS
jgi:hypothetical protein